MRPMKSGHGSYAISSWIWTPTALRWFQLVADGYTVTEVSEVFGVSQPGVSRALARLEQEVGTPLLRRSGRVLRMTHAGTAFKRHVDNLVNDLDDGMAAVDELVDPEGGVVTLAFPLSLGLVARARPDPGVPARPPAGADGAAAHRRGRERAGVAAARHPARRRRAHHPPGRPGPGVEWRRILVEPLVLAVPTDPPAGRAATRSPWPTSPTSRSSCAGARPACARRRSPCARRPASRPTIDFEADDLPTVRGLVAAGLGVAVVPAMGLPAPTTFARTRLLPLTDADAQREVGVAWVAGRPLLPSAESFRRFLLTGEATADLG